MAKKKIPDWLVLGDSGMRCLRCGKDEKMPQPMPAMAFTSWAEYQGALHQGCKDTGRVDFVATSVGGWIHGHDTGISSKAIWLHMMGMPRERVVFGDYPLDPSDFGRCYRLLALEPSWRGRIGEMAQYSQAWSALAGAWDELTAMYEAALADEKKQAPVMYGRMRALINSRRSPGAAHA
jgi:hypothetical protein